jgi:radical SAM superfamily enzyme YgiQ (UPF0313 family)
MAHAVIICGQAVGYSAGRSAGAYIIANVFRQYGITAIVLDRFLSMQPAYRQQLIEKFVDDDTRFICVSSTLMGNKIDGNGVQMSDVDAQLAPWLELCKQRAPLAVTIVGGSRITAKESIGFPYDYAVIGQGERTLLAIVNHELYGDTLISTVNRGTTHYVSDKTYGYDSYNTSTYLRFTDDDAVLHNEVLPLEFGRGCVFKCSYCNYPLIGKSFNEFTRSKELLIADFKYNWEKFGINKYVLIDDTCNDSIEKVQIWHDAVKESQVPVEFAGYMRLELFHKYPEMAKLYLDSGLKAAIFGIETFNKEAGVTVGKGFGEKAKDTLLALKQVWGEEVAIQGNFIVGLPHDSIEQLDEQFEWLMSTKAVHIAAFHALSITNRSDSILASEYKSYYEVDRINEKSGVVYWRSPVMTFEHAINMVDSYRSRWREANTGYVNRASGFQVMVLSQYYDFETLYNRDLTVDERKKINRARNIAYKNKLLTQVDNPKAELPTKRLTPVVKPGGVFESRNVKRTIRLKQV